MYEPASLCSFFNESLLLTAMDKFEDVVKVSIPEFSAQSGRDFTIFDFVITEYRADVLSVNRPARTARLTDSAYIKTVRTAVGEGRRSEQAQLFSFQGEKILQLLGPAPSVVHCKLTALL